ncbi:MAG TPA: hypothetical protein VH092_19720 [Urbifossiella sp.]|nr:hypothetical protein [Urbifossiella sp.]
MDQAILFKKQLRAVLLFPDGVSSMIVPDPESHSCEVRVAYERDNPVAAAWVKRAEELSQELWGALSVRRKERGPA